MMSFFVESEEYFSTPFNERSEKYKANEESICGRLMFSRGNFFDISSADERIQLFVPKELLHAGKNDLKMGNIVKVSGVRTKSKAGKDIISIHSYNILSRAYRHVKMNDEYAELHPFLDAVRNLENQEKIIQQGLLIQSMQNFFQEKGIIPIYTSPIENMETGLTASAFYLKNDGRMLRREFEIPSRAYLLFGRDVYQLGTVFRNHGTTSKNRNDFFVANIYLFYKDINDCKKFCVDFFNSLRKQVNMQELTLPEADFRSRVAVIGEQSVRSQWKAVKKITEEPIIYKGFSPEMVPFGQLENNNEDQVKDFALVWQGRTILKATEEITDYFVQRERYRKIYGENFNQKLSDGEKRYLSLLQYGIPPFVSITISVDLLSQMLLRIPNVNSLRPTVTQRISQSQTQGRQRGD
ncbi:MAG: hypothetical protein IJY92_03540 [Alphaproteobacteria bacterium]|nr:hypothetical protein [Alphaproteobacteria bacterium]